MNAFAAFALHFYVLDVGFCVEEELGGGVVEVGAAVETGIGFDQRGAAAGPGDKEGAVEGGVRPVPGCREEEQVNRRFDRSPVGEGDKGPVAQEGGVERGKTLRRVDEPKELFGLLRAFT